MTTSVHVSIDVPELECGLGFYGRVFGFVENFGNGFCVIGEHA